MIPVVLTAPSPGCAWTVIRGKAIVLLRRPPAALPARRSLPASFPKGEERTLHTCGEGNNLRTIGQVVVYIIGVGEKGTCCVALAAAKEQLKSW